MEADLGKCGGAMACLRPDSWADTIELRKRAIFENKRGAAKTCRNVVAGQSCKPSIFRLMPFGVLLVSIKPWRGKYIEENGTRVSEVLGCVAVEQVNRWLVNINFGSSSKRSSFMHSFHPFTEGLKKSKGM